LDSVDERSDLVVRTVLELELDAFGYDSRRIAGHQVSPALCLDREAGSDRFSHQGQRVEVVQIAFLLDSRGGDDFDRHSVYELDRLGLGVEAGDECFEPGFRQVGLLIDLKLDVRCAQHPVLKNLIALGADVGAGVEGILDRLEREQVAQRIDRCTIGHLEHETVGEREVPSVTLSTRPLVSVKVPAEGLIDATAPSNSSAES
jgi:hypothetical protein